MQKTKLKPLVMVWPSHSKGKVHAKAFYLQRRLQGSCMWGVEGVGEYVQIGLVATAPQVLSNHLVRYAFSSSQEGAVLTVASKEVLWIPVTCSNVHVQLLYVTANVARCVLSVD